MKKTLLTKENRTEEPDMLPEYNFDYSKSRPNRFAGKISEGRMVVLLDAEVTAYFTTPDAVNSVLKALVTTLPAKQKMARKRNRA